MESTKDHVRPNRSARSKKTTQIQARSVKSNASVWLFGLDGRSWCFMIFFCRIAFYKQPLLRRGCLAGFSVVFLFTRPPARGAHEAHAPIPGIVWSVFGVILFIFRSFLFQHHWLIYQCSAFILQPIPSSSGDVLQLWSSSDEYFQQIWWLSTRLTRCFWGKGYRFTSIRMGYTGNKHH